MNHPSQVDATDKSGVMSGQASEGKVLIESIGDQQLKAELCISRHTQYTHAEAIYLLKVLPQVVTVCDVNDFCAEMRALGCAAWTRMEWQGTDAAWSEVERRLPPFRIGKYTVTSYDPPCVELFSGHGGGVRFNLEKCEAYESYGTDRMNAGGWSTSFDKSRIITAGEVYRWAASFIKDSWDYSLSAEELADETVLWPVAPYASFAGMESAEDRAKSLFEAQKKLLAVLERLTKGKD